MNVTQSQKVNAVVAVKDMLMCYTVYISTDDKEPMVRLINDVLTALDIDYMFTDNEVKAGKGVIRFVKPDTDLKSNYAITVLHV